MFCPEHGLLCFPAASHLSAVLYVLLLPFLQVQMNEPVPERPALFPAVRLPAGSVPGFLAVLCLALPADVLPAAPAGGPPEACSPADVCLKAAPVLRPAV